MKTCRIGNFCQVKLDICFLMDSSIQMQAVNGQLCPAAATIVRIAILVAARPFLEEMLLSVFREDHL